MNQRDNLANELEDTELSVIETIVHQQNELTRFALVVSESITKMESLNANGPALQLLRSSRVKANKLFNELQFTLETLYGEATE